jgi:hypothetical protein
MLWGLATSGQHCNARARCFDPGARLQVSVKPPVAVAHAETPHWVFDQVSAPTTRFTGNTVEVYPTGEAAGAARACVACSSPARPCFTLC